MISMENKARKKKYFPLVWNKKFQLEISFTTTVDVGLIPQNRRFKSIWHILGTLRRKLGKLRRRRQGERLKYNRLQWAKQQLWLHVHHAFLYISPLSLHNYNVE